MPDPPRRRPSVLGVDISEADVSRSVRRSHPAAESSSPPGPPPRPPYQPNLTPHELPVFDTTRLPGAHLHRVEQGPLPPPPRRSMFPGHPAAKWAGLAAIIAALGGGAGIAEILRSKPLPTASPEDFADLRSDVREIRDHLRRVNDVVGERTELNAAAITKLNGWPFVRGLEDINDIAFDVRPQDAPQPLPPKYRMTREHEWPFLPKAPRR